VGVDIELEVLLHEDSDGHVGHWQGCLDLKTVTVTRDSDDEGELEGVQDQPEELDIVTVSLDELVFFQVSPPPPVTVTGRRITVTVLTFSPPRQSIRRPFPLSPPEAWLCQWRWGGPGPQRLRAPLP
jgi:hypothetical protein